MQSVIEEKQQVKEERERGKENQVMQRILDYLELCPDGDTKSGIRESTGINSQTLVSAIHSAIQQGLIERCMVLKNNRTHDGFALKKSTQDATVE